jgi:hypothetical protein
MKSPDILKRILEPFPSDGMTHFKAGNKVRLARSYVLWQEIPVGAEGVVLSVGQDEMMNEKGRPYEVQFNLEPYQIPIFDELRQAFIRAGLQEKDIPKYHLAITTHVGPNDIELLID